MNYLVIKYITIFLGVLLFLSNCKNKTQKTELQNQQSNTDSTKNIDSDRSFFEEVRHNLTHQYGGKIEGGFDKLNRLSIIKIENMSIEGIPIGLAKFKHLIRISISNSTKLHEFENLSHFPNLKSLSVWHGNFMDTTFIPPCNLEYLALVDCNIKTIIFSEKSKIKTLQLWGNKIKQIHPSMYEINNLEDLSLIDNPFSNIEIEKFKYLKKLGLSDNQANCGEVQIRFPDLDFSCKKYDNSERPWRGPLYD